MSVFLSVQWLEDHLFMYDVAEPCLHDALGEYEQVAHIPAAVSEELVRRLTVRSGVLATFVFCVLSSVRLDEAVFERLRVDAEEAQRLVDDEMSLLHKSVSLLDTATEQSPPPPGLHSSAAMLAAERVTRTLSRSMNDLESSPVGATLSPLALAGPRRAWQFTGRSASVSNVMARRGLDATAGGSVPPAVAAVPLANDASAHTATTSTSSSGAAIVAPAASLSSRLIRPERRTGWLDKLRGVSETAAQLLESAADMALSDGSEQRWKRRWVVLEDAKITWFASPDNGGDQRGCVPLYLVSSIRTHPELGSTAFGIKCGHLVQFVFRASSEEDMTRWLWTMQQWLASAQHRLQSTRRKGGGVAAPVAVGATTGGAPEPLVHSILSVGRWWKKLNFVSSRKSSLENFIATTERDSEQSVIGKFAVATETHRPHVAPSAKRSLFEAACVASTQGQRPSMEDGHIACTEVTAVTCKWGFERSATSAMALFAVFDGHGGPEAAVFCTERLGPVLAACCPTLGALDLRNSVDSEAAKRALVQCFARLDSQFLESATDALLPQPVLAGTTALVVLVHEHTLAVANLGDSRAVLSRGGGQCVALSVDHKPNDAAERARIVAAGGWITESKVLDVSKLWRLNPRLLQELSIPKHVGEEIGFVTSYRVLGELSVSRAIGDAETKDPLKRDYWPEHCFSADVISCEPDVVVVAREPALDEFLILACDGFWDVLDSQEAISFCAQRLQAHLSSAGASLSASVESPSGKHALPSHSSGVQNAVKAVAEDLVHEALRRGSLDNVTLVLVVFAAALPAVTPPRAALMMTMVSSSSASGNAASKRLFV